jgi:hypothetical protein
MLAVAAQHGHAEPVEEPQRAFSDCLEDRVGVSRRSRDHAENLARGRLLLQGLGHLGMGLRERPVLLLQLCEQAGVLDGDHRLVGEGHHQLDLPIGERFNPQLPHRDDADEHVLSKHGHRQDGSEALQVLRLGGLIAGLGQYVMDVNGPTPKCGPGGAGAKPRTDRVSLPVVPERR